VTTSGRATFGTGFFAGGEAHVRDHRHEAHWFKEAIARSPNRREVDSPPAWARWNLERDGGCSLKPKRNNPPEAAQRSHGALAAAAHTPWIIVPP